MCLEMTEMSFWNNSVICAMKVQGKWMTAEAYAW